MVTIILKCKVAILFTTFLINLIYIIVICIVMNLTFCVFAFNHISERVVVLFEFLIHFNDINVHAKQNYMPTPNMNSFKKLLYCGTVSFLYFIYGFSNSIHFAAFYCLQYFCKKHCFLHLPFRIVFTTALKLKPLVSHAHMLHKDNISFILNIEKTSDKI